MERISAFFRRPSGGTGRDARREKLRARRLWISLCLLVLAGVFRAGELPNAAAGLPRPASAVSRQIYLDGPGGMEGTPCDVVQVLDRNGKPGAYFMDVDSVVCPEAKCEIVTVRLHFDILGNFERYELPSGGNLTKSGHKPFTPADHEKLQQILYDPYSPLKDVAWNQITLPKDPADGGGDIDAISGPTVLSKRDAVVAGAAYTCCTLWHWSHGETAKVIRDMTVSASDRQDWIRFLNSGNDIYAEFAFDQLSSQGLFDSETIAAVVQVMRHGSDRLADPAFHYLAAASSETGADCFFGCCEDEFLAENAAKRVQFLEALRDNTQPFPAGYLERFGGWLRRADTYYEVHLLLTLCERENVSSDEIAGEAIALLESDDSLVVRRCFRYLKARKLNPSQQEKFAAFERLHPDP